MKSRIHGMKIMRCETGNSKQSLNYLFSSVVCRPFCQIMLQLFDTKQTIKQNNLMTVLSFQVPTKLNIVTFKVTG